MIPLRGKLALITGGSRGIGLAIAHAFAAHGASTILVGRNPDTLRSAVQSVQAQPVLPCPLAPPSTDEPEPAPAPAPAPAPGEHTTQQPFHCGAEGDVRHPDTWEHLYHRLDQGHFGRRGACHPTGAYETPDRVDVLVNCAGVAQSSLLIRTPTEDIETILDSNLKSAVLGCKYIARQMIRSGLAPRAPSRPDGAADRKRDESGMSIINVSSVMASRGGCGASVYAATKAGILGLTSALSVELGQYGIRVNALVPGYIKTDMIENLVQDLLPKQIPLRRVGRVEEVADAAVFLAQNSYANNCVLTIDGGLSAGLTRPF